MRRVFLSVSVLVIASLWTSSQKYGGSGQETWDQAPQPQGCRIRNRKVPVTGNVVRFSTTDFDTHQVKLSHFSLAGRWS